MPTFDEPIIFTENGVEVARIGMTGDGLTIERTDSGGARVTLDAAGRIGLLNGAWGEIVIADNGDVKLATAATTVLVKQSGGVTVDGVPVP